MAIKEREYLISVNEFKEPRKVEKARAIGLLLVRLIVMDPGSDPLHPTMGVGIKKYRYGLNNLEELRKECQYQIDTFLPCFPNADVEITYTPDKICSIQVTINDMKFVYDTGMTDTPIKLIDIENG